jgi:3'-phosphoadenosine 5'-phosphosulfate sulfotransferase (PAPS reductase)/FAD synthetase
MPCAGEADGRCFDLTDRLTYLQALEAESIHILREVAAEFSRPVMLYSIGKDSSVMLRLALKAFYPAKPIPWPLLHVDTVVQVPRDDRIPRSLRAQRAGSGG